ncbi:MAG: hypothetical protein C4527_19170 [Candidatus Omnitrophota bacterium]|jgi:hypothetical protein|nr:MAG: hypothetical protein C4527_19170 [Candidatus Omnitrophota bacterium]
MRKKSSETGIIISLLIVILSTSYSSEHERRFKKQAGALYPHTLVETAIDNARSHSWAREIQERITARSRPWLEASDDDLWNAMFGPTISPSWMVWSDGICPACKKDVKMYNWQIDVWKHPFKVCCPNCAALFPTNDFQAYYRSGLNEHGVFDPNRADRTLLFHAEHADGNDPLRSFGVDDGEGYVEGEKRWRFIGYYLSAGQWRQKIIGGIASLSEAYLVTGDSVYARKAAILLDRVADVYPTFDFSQIGWVYETRGHRGYVSTWHDACEEVREMAQGYDRIFDAIKNDEQLVQFLSAKAKEFSLENRKSTFTEIQANIENNIFHHTLAHRQRIESNFPRTPIALLTIETVLEWPNNREKILSLLSDIANESLLEDGMTGEKGLTGYSAIFPHGFAELIARFDRLDPVLFADLYEKHKDIYKTYRFYIDTWCLDRFYPHEGDCGSFGMETPRYGGVTFSRPAMSAEPSMFQFLWRLYELTGDTDFVKILYHANDEQLDALPHDICAENPQEFQNKVKTIIDAKGKEIHLSDIQKKEWGLSILRSGEGDHRRAVWLDHDAGGRHSHRDGLNIGLFAKGLDLLPDFGYPPVGYGGWGAPKAVWYTKTAAHNTVVVDGNNQQAAKGVTTLWGSGKQVHMVRVSAPDLIKGEQYERTVALVDISPQDFYVVDIFHVTGGRDHAKFMSSFFGKCETKNLTLTPSADFGHETEMRNFRTDANPPFGWSVDWTVEDRYGYLPAKKEIHLRYTDLTYKAQVSLSECWVDSGLFGGSPEWIPRLMIRRTQEQPPLASCFAGIIEPHEGESSIRAIRRLPLTFQGQPTPCEMCGVIQLDLKDGRRQYFAFTDSLRKPKGRVIQSAISLAFDAAVCLITIEPNGNRSLALCNGSFLRFGNMELRLREDAAFMEISFIDNQIRMITGEEQQIEFLGLIE